MLYEVITAVLAYEGFTENAEVSVSFVDNAEIKNLNNDYRKKDVPTDVLSFPLGEDGNYDFNNETSSYMLGDIVISLETALKQSIIYGHSLEREIGFLTRITSYNVCYTKLLRIFSRKRKENHF